MAQKKRVNAKGKGSRNERLVKEILIENGYDYVTKAGGSLGVFDLIGFRSYLEPNPNNPPYAVQDEEVIVNLCIQVKSNRLATPKERGEIKAVYPDANPKRFKKQLWIVYDGNRKIKKPPIRIISFEGENEFEYFYGFEHHKEDYAEYLRFIF